MFRKLYCVHEVEALKDVEIFNVYKDISITEIAIPDRITGKFLMERDLLNVFLFTQELVSVKIRNKHFEKVVEMMGYTDEYPIQRTDAYEQMRTDQGIAYDQFYEEFVFKTNDNEKINVFSHYFMFSGTSLEKLSFQMNVAYFESGRKEHIKHTTKLLYDDLEV